MTIDDGVDHSKFSREWLEQVINSNIAPRIDGLKISQVPLSGDRSAFCVQVPKSFRAPHQETVTKKYFKRFNFQSVPMEDYEITDVRSRINFVRPLVSVDVELRHRVMVYIVIENTSEFPVKDVVLSFRPELPWASPREGLPPLVKNGIRHFSPGKRHMLFYESYIEIANNEEIPSAFTVEVQYYHPVAQQNIREAFPIDLEDYLHTACPESDVYEVGKKIEEVIGKLTQEVKKLKGDLESLASLSSSTGLELSYGTLRSLEMILAGKEDARKYDPRFKGRDFFQEVLGVGRSMARRLEAHFFGFRPEGKRLEDIEGMTGELRALISSRLNLEEDA